MPLKLGPITTQVNRMTAAMTPLEQDDLLVQAQQLLRNVDPIALRKHLEERVKAPKKRVPWLAALPTATLAGKHPAPQPPADFAIASADGSAIHPDRHSPFQYYVINTGYAVLTYGAHPDAVLDSEGNLYFEDDDLYIDPQGQRIPVNEGRLSRTMQVEGMKALWCYLVLEGRVGFYTKCLMINKILLVHLVFRTLLVYLKLININNPGYVTVKC